MFSNGPKTMMIFLLLSYYSLKINSKGSKIVAVTGYAKRKIEYPKTTKEFRNILSITRNNLEWRRNKVLYTPTVIGTLIRNSPPDIKYVQYKERAKKGINHRKDRAT
jgi:hypothetical protein